MRQITYYVIEMLKVQIGFITTLIYVVPQIMYGIFRSLPLLVAQWMLYFGFAWLGAWPFLAGIIFLWLRVTVLTVYFIDEAWTLHNMGRHHNHAEPQRSRGVPLTF